MPTKHASHKLVCDCNTLYNGCLTLCQAKCSTGVSLSVALHVSDWESISTISGWTLIHYRVFPVLHFPDEYPFIIHLGGEKLCEVIVHKKKPNASQHSTDNTILLHVTVEILLYTVYQSHIINRIM